MVYINILAISFLMVASLAVQAKTTLIIGGTGQIGFATTVLQLGSSDRTIVIGRSSADSKNNKIVTDHPKGEYVQLDIGDNSAKLLELIKEVKPDQIFNFAEVYPLSFIDVESGVKESIALYDSLLDADFQGPVVVAGSAAVERAGQGYPSVDWKSYFDKVPYFVAKKRMMDLSRKAFEHGLDVRRVALPWIVSGDKHHGNMEALIAFTSMRGWTRMAGLVDMEISAITSHEAAKILDLVATKGSGGWTYLAGGVSINIGELHSLQLKEIKAKPIRRRVSSRGLIENQLKMTLGYLDSYSRRQSQSEPTDSAYLNYQKAALAMILTLQLPKNVDNSLLTEMGYSTPEELQSSIEAEAKKHAKLVCSEILEPMGFEPDSWYIPY